MVGGLRHAGTAGQGPTGCTILDFLLPKATDGLACFKHPEFRGLTVDRRTEHFPPWVEAASVVSGLPHAGTVGRGPTSCSILDIFPELRSPSVDRRTVPLPRDVTVDRRTEHINTGDEGTAKRTAGTRPNERHAVSVADHNYWVGVIAQESARPGWPQSKQNPTAVRFEGVRHPSRGATRTKVPRLPRDSRFRDIVLFYNTKDFKRFTHDQASIYDLGIYMDERVRDTTEVVVPRRKFPGNQKVVSYGAPASRWEARASGLQDISAAAGPGRAGPTELLSPPTLNPTAVPFVPRKGSATPPESRSAPSPPDHSTVRPAASPAPTAPRHALAGLLCPPECSSPPASSTERPASIASPSAPAQRHSTAPQEQGHGARNRRRNRRRRALRKLRKNVVREATCGSSGVANFDVHTDVLGQLGLPAAQNGPASIARQRAGQQRLEGRRRRKNLVEKKGDNPSGTAKVEPTSDIHPPGPRHQLPGTGLASPTPHPLRAKAPSFSPAQSGHWHGNAPDD